MDLKEDIGDVLPSPTKLFLWIWTATIQKKIVCESNRYANWVDPTLGHCKGGDCIEPNITSQEFQCFTGICILMGVQNLPALCDYWSIIDDSLRCPEVSNSMAKNRFHYILRVLHVFPKGSLVHDKKNPCYDAIGQVRWMLECM